MDYTIDNGEYYQVLDKDNQELITYGKLADGNILSTMHVVEFITTEQYYELKNSVL